MQSKVPSSLSLYLELLEGSATFMVHLPTSNRLIKKVPHWGAFVVPLIPDLVKRTAKISHHTCR